MKIAKDLELEKNRRTLDSEAKRLLFAVKKAGMQAVESKSGITQNTFQSWARTESEIEDMVLNELLIDFGISKNFVRTSKGNWKATPEEKLARYNEIVKSNLFEYPEKMDIHSKRAINLAENLDSDDIEIIIKMCYRLLEEKKNKTFRSLISLTFTLPKTIYSSVYNLLVGYEKGIYKNRK